MSSERSPRALSRRALLVGTAAALQAAARSAEQSRPAPSFRSPRFDVERFIEDCRHANRETHSAQSAVQDVMARAIARPAAVLAALGAPEKGGIRTLYRSAELTILNIVWAPLMQLLPHEHNMWSLIGIYTGREDNIFWQRQRGRVVATTATAISEGSAVPLPKDVIHSVANPIEKLTGAIHVYGGDFFAVSRSEWDPETLLEREWSIERAMRIFEQSNERFFAWRARTDPANRRGRCLERGESSGGARRAPS